MGPEPSSRDAEDTASDQPSSAFASDPEIQNLTIELMEYGITSNQAKLYVYLLGRGAAPAVEISKAIGLHRVDVYRKLRELEGLGMIEVHFDVPKRFAAVNPRMAIGTLVTKLTSKVDALRESSIQLEHKLTSLRARQKAQKAQTMPMTYNDISYRYGMGRQNYLREVGQLTRDAKEEILRIAPPNGLRRAYISGSFKDIKAAVERGVSMRMITEINDSNLRFAKMLSKFIHVRHLSGVGFRLIISDRSRAILSARFDEKLLTAVADLDGYFTFEDPVVTSVWRFLFEHLWATAVEVEDAAGNIRSRHPKVSIPRQES